MNLLKWLIWGSSVLLAQELTAQTECVVFIRVRFFGPKGSNTKAPLEIKYKILFKGNQSIQEVPLLTSKKDSTHDEASFRIKHVSFLDLDKNTCSNYSSFSDTAKLLKQYNHIDSVVKKGGWNFYNQQKMGYMRIDKLRDTSINEILYQRLKMIRVINGQQIYLILYSRQDKQNSPITLFKNLSDSLSLPIFRDDVILKEIFI